MIPTRINIKIADDKTSVSKILINILQIKSNKLYVIEILYTVLVINAGYKFSTLPLLIIVSFLLLINGIYAVSTSNMHLIIFAKSSENILPMLILNR